jgi:hypothetical protein
LKIAAREKDIRSVSLREDKLVAVMHGEEIRPGGRYPRVSGNSAAATVREMRRILEGL